METYIVKRGDTLESIASLYNIPAVEIIKANNIQAPYLLMEGQALNIPTGVFSIFNYYTVKKGDTLYKIASMYQTTPSTLAAINGLQENEYIYENQTLLVPKPNISTYITKETDTISSVANYFNTTPEAVIYSNKDIYLLPDQLLIYRKIWFILKSMV